MTVTAQTPDRLVFTAGALAVGGVALGATMDGNIVRWEMDVNSPHFHGVRGPLKRGEFMSRFVPYLETTVAELIGVHFGYAIAGAGSASNASSEVVSGFVPGCFEAADYHDVVLTVTKCSGLTQIITVKDAIVTEAGEVTYHDEGEPARLRLVFRGSYSPSNPTVAPLTIVNHIHA
jgi:hypothetical protein